MRFMRKYEGGSSALFVTPEPPYPVVGGGALRSSSLLEYLLQGHDVDAITFAEKGVTVRMPGVRDLWTVTLPHHSRSPFARAWRNFARFVRGVPPLLDRFSGFDGRHRRPAQRPAIRRCRGRAFLVRSVCRVAATLCWPSRSGFAQYRIGIAGVDRGE